jgi:hypothetical protein
MASRKNIQVASSIGTIGADHLQNLLADGRYNTAQIAAIAGTSTARLTNLLAEPAPLPLRPRNWTSSAAVGSVAPYIGVTPTVYAGPSTPGYTYGAPLAAREDFS